MSVRSGSEGRGESTGPRVGPRVDEVGTVGFAERHVMTGAVVTVVLLVLGGAALGGAGGTLLARLLQTALTGLAGGT